VPSCSVRDREIPVPPATQYDSGPDEVRRLIERVQAGDTEAFGLLYNRHSNRVFRFVYRRVRDRHLAEDLTADTFVRAFTGLHQLHWQGRDIDGWLLTIAARLVLDHYRWAQVRQATPASFVGTGPTDHSAEVVDRLDLRAAMAQLDPQLREVMMHRLYLDLSVAATAAAMRCSEGSVKRLLHQAKHALAQLLAGCARGQGGEVR